MVGGKFIEVVSTFSKEELKRFRKFLESPFFNTNENVIKAFNYIYESSGVSGHAHLSKEEIHKAVYSSRPYKDENIRYIFSELLRLAESFLAYIGLEKKSKESGQYLLNELNERNLDKFFEKKLKASQESVEEININDSYHFKLKYELLALESSYFTERIEFVNSGVDKRTSALTGYYVIEMLKEYRFFINQSISGKYKGDILFKDEIMEFALKNNFLNIPLIEILYRQVCALKEPSEEANYFKLKELTLRHAKDLTYVEKYNSFVMLLNFANRMAGEGNERFKRESFELHKASAAENAIAKDSYIAPLRFEAIVEDALRLKEYDWLDGFILNNKRLLPANERDEMVYYCFARISYEKGDLEKSLEYFSKAGFSHITMNLRRRTFSVRLYYELGYLESFASAIDSYKHYLANNGSIMPVKVYDAYLNFVKLLPELLKVTTLPEKQKIERFKEKVSLAGKLTEKQWLMEKINLLERENAYRKKA